MTDASSPADQSHPGGSRLRPSITAGLGRLQSLLRPKKEPEVAKPKPMSSPSKTTKEHQDARLTALWQLLVTGFELIKYPKTGRARKRVLWLTLDGRLCVGRAKSDKHMGTFMHLWDIERVEKGCASSPQFTTSKSSQDIQEELSWSIQATSAKDGSTYSFALQVISSRVRDLVVENLSMLIQLLHPNDVPRGVRARLAVHFASTGEVLADLEPFMEILDSLEGDNDHGVHQDDSDSGEEEERLG
ncbi:hypothetical protein Ae201684P_004408 [Aphanomyces euteiches]|nr:hypothetical protein Ae201684P_004408 [Aphanomyces euteiches]